MADRGAAAGGLAARSHLTPTMDVVEAGRIVKDEWEIERLREAGRRISAVAMGVIADLRPGQREQDVAQAIEAGLRRAGFSRPAFDTIVASGPRAALPHGRASDRVMAAGDLVVLDFGGVYGGYCVDLTRTVVLGTPSAEAGPGARRGRRGAASRHRGVRPGRAGGRGRPGRARPCWPARPGRPVRPRHRPRPGTGSARGAAGGAGTAGDHAPMPGTVSCPRCWRPGWW